MSLDDSLWGVAEASRFLRVPVATLYQWRHLGTGPESPALRLSDHLPLGDARVVAVIAADEPTEEDERRRIERDDAKVWGERVPYDRLVLAEN
ncbi:hypothetical protein AB0M44_42605 [Streptosporangium subroseum]|uniref:hypothetical protein n=1 Tax=Streptosporangium subroseum TaxID=106412 RepID=UPI00343B120A